MAKAVAKFIRMSPRKLRRVIDVIRGKEANEAMTALKFMPYAASGVVEKVLKSAIANAKENEKLDPNELRVIRACVDQSTTLRRWRAMSRGRGYPILKRTSHVTVEVKHDPSIEHVHTTTAHHQHVEKVEKKEIQNQIVPTETKKEKKVKKVKDEKETKKKKTKKGDKGK